MKRESVHGFFTNKTVKKLKPKLKNYFCNSDVYSLTKRRFDYGILDKYSNYNSAYCTHCSFRCCNPENFYHSKSKSVLKERGKNKCLDVNKKTFNKYHKNLCYEQFVDE